MFRKILSSLIFLLLFPYSAHASYELINMRSMALIPFFEQMRLKGCTKTTYDDVNTTKGQVEVLQFKGCSPEAGLITITGVDIVGAIYDTPSDKDAAVKAILKMVGASVLKKKEEKPENKFKDGLLKHGMIFMVYANNKKDYGEESIQIQVSGGTLSVYSPALKDNMAKTLTNLRRGDCVLVRDEEGILKDDNVYILESPKEIRKVKCE